MAAESAFGAHNHRTRQATRITAIKFHPRSYGPKILESIDRTLHDISALVRLRMKRWWTATTSALCSSIPLDIFPLWTHQPNSPRLNKSAIHPNPIGAVNANDWRSRLRLSLSQTRNTNGFQNGKEEGSIRNSARRSMDSHGQQTVRIDLGQSLLVGEVLSVEFMTYRLRVSQRDVFDVSLWSVEPGGVHVVEDSRLYRLPSSPLLDPDGLPVWNYAEGRWIEATPEPMEGEQGLNALSIRACQAMGTAAFRRYCAHHGISHPEVTAFVEHGYAMADTQDIVAWEQNGPPLVRASLGTDLPELLSQVVGRAHRPSFEYLLVHVTAIGYTDLYGAVTSAPWRHLRAALAVLDGEGIPRPPIEAFLASPASEVHGWGEPVTAALKLSWMALGS